MSDPRTSAVAKPILATGGLANWVPGVYNRPIVGRRPRPREGAMSLASGTCIGPGQIQSDGGTLRLRPPPPRYLLVRRPALRRDEPVAVRVSHKREEEGEMKRMLSLALVAALVMAAVPVAAQRPYAVSAAGSCSADAAGNGPLARAALREASTMLLQTSPEQEQKATPESVSAVREAARKIPLGKKVKVKALSGEQHKGILRTAGERSVLIEMPGWVSTEKGTYEPAAIEVSYDTMRSIERDKMGWGVKTAIIAGIAVVTLWAVLATLAAETEPVGRR
jgi:hypothetical protein